MKRGSGNIVYLHEVLSPQKLLLTEHFQKIQRQVEQREARIKATKWCFSRLIDGLSIRDIQQITGLSAVDCETIHHVGYACLNEEL